MRVLEQEEKKRRKNRLLQTVILEYIRTASPVASGAVSHTEGMQLSPATVRNMLHELEKEGFLTQPHTSAGRLPTDKGYRYYVDYLLHLQELLGEERQKIEQEYERRLGEIETILSRTSRMLAYLSHQAGFVLRPKMEVSTLQRMELIACDDTHILLVLVAKNGFIRYRLLRSPGLFNEEELRRVSHWVNKRFQGKNLKDLCGNFDREMRDQIWQEAGRLEEILKSFAEPIAEMLQTHTEEELLLEGTANILSTPEVSQVGSMRRLVETLEDKQEMLALLKKEIQKAESKSKKGVSVVIGDEARVPELRDLSVVAKAFETDKNTVGVLGILGPKRMEYGRMVSLVEAIYGALQKAIGV
ncbi:MAG: heat-inducible transcription repressor HrcA [Elusimicrobia bacterium]|nr:heat-inducible transcription repressor HrcA [Elusimicrobiota bacterium]